MHHDPEDCLGCPAFLAKARKRRRRFSRRILGGHTVDADALSRAIEAVYKNTYYSFAKDLVLDDVEKRTTAHLERLLRIDDEQAAAFQYEVGLAIYKRRFQEFLADGELSHAEQEVLDRIAATFGIHKRHIKKAISQHALAHYSFVLANALKDGVLTSTEMAELETLCRRFGLTKTELSTIPVPDKKEVLAQHLQQSKRRATLMMKIDSTSARWPTT